MVLHVARLWRIDASESLAWDRPGKVRESLRRFGEVTLIDAVDGPHVRVDSVTHAHEELHLADVAAQKHALDLRRF
jgi:hypothetical protein